MVVGIKSNLCIELRTLFPQRVHVGVIDACLRLCPLDFRTETRAFGGFVGEKLSQVTHFSRELLFTSNALFEAEFGMLCEKSKMDDKRLLQMHSFTSE